MIIGIDFGTCFSSVAYMVGKLPKDDLISDPNGTGIPSLFMYSRNLQQELYGYDCAGSLEAIMNSTDVIRYMKRIVRENPNNLNAEVSSGGKKFTINEILKKYLEYLIAQIRNAAKKSGNFDNTKVECVTITVPIGISEGQMTATDYNKLLVDTIREITGLSQDKINVLQEPVAAAISYLYSDDMRKKLDKKQTILVFDLGGGTLDVTVVEHNPSTKEYNIKAKEGDLKLGGNDWDEALENAVLRKAGISGTFVDAEEKIRFQNKIVELKQRLTISNVEDVMFKFNRSTKIVENFSRSEFEVATKNLLDRAIEVTKKAIESYSTLGVSAIDKIVLVGGSCNMPQIRNRMISEFSSLGESRIILHDPSKAIARGAAIYSWLREHEPVPDPNPDPNLVPNKEKNITVNDIVSCTYGWNCINSDNGKEMIYNLLFKGTKFDKTGLIKVTTSSPFGPVKDDQTSCCFCVYESNAVKQDSPWMALNDNNAKKNGMEVKITIPEKYYGIATQYKYYKSLMLDKNGVLEIIVTDEEGKQIAWNKKQI